MTDKPYRIFERADWWHVTRIGDEDRLNGWVYPEAANWWATNLNVAYEDGLKKGWKAGMEEAAKIVERNMIYGNRENPMWAQSIIAGEIRRRAGEEE